MALFIYSRVSTGKQDPQSQLAKLTAKYAGAEVHEETASGVKKRPVLYALLERLQPGDTLVVAELSRLGRRMTEIVRNIENLHARGVSVISEREQVNYSTPVGRLVAQILASMAEFERELLIERTRDALDARRERGIVGGRRPKFSPDVLARARELRAQGKTCREVAKELGMSASRVSEVCRATKAA